MNDKKREILLNSLFDSVKKDLDKKDFERIENAVSAFQKNFNQALLEFKKETIFFMSLLKKDLCVEAIELTDTKKKEFFIALGLAFSEFKSVQGEFHE